MGCCCFLARQIGEDLNADFVFLRATSGRIWFCGSKNSPIGGAGSAGVLVPRLFHLPIGQPILEFRVFEPRPFVQPGKPRGMAEAPEEHAHPELAGAIGRE